MIEIWKPVVGLEKYYEVSSLGRVKTKERKEITPKGYNRTVRERIKSPTIWKMEVMLCATSVDGPM